MPASEQLNYWIAESGSWQSFIDFHLPDDARAKYRFYPRYDDFYLSLMSRAIELLKDKENLENNEELLSVAKGLEIFSLKEKRKYFKGINYSNNALFAAGLYYLANYSASAWILAKIYPSRDYNDIDEFVSNFLKRKLNTKNELDSFLSNFLQTGDLIFLENLLTEIYERKEKSFDEDVEIYYSFVLAEALLLKFRNDNIWNDLLRENNNREHWKEYVLRSIRKKVPIWSFFPSQKLAIEKGLLRGMTCSLQMPTSSGKTAISELLIFDEHQKNPECKILYLAPFRALASELKQSLAVNLGLLGIKSKTIYGGDLPTVEEKSSILEVNLLIATPEKFMAVENVFPGIDKEFTTIICDEGHLLDDDSRGLSYELLLSRLKEDTGINRRFVFISAIIPNIAVVNSWLGGSEETVISSNYRPTELEYGFLREMETGSGYYLDVNPFEDKPQNYQLYKYLYGDDLTFINPKTGRENRIKSKKGISVAAALKATQSGTVILFAPHKRGNTGVEGLASEAILQLSNNAEISSAEHTSEESLNYQRNLIEYFNIVFGSDYLLTECSRYGFLFHHGDFPQNIREIIEDALRSEHIRFAICTNTLAEGVNLPIKTIVLHSTRRFNPNVVGKYEQIKIRDLKNLVGRAGRAGKETRGLVIIPHTENINIIRDLVLNRNIEDVKGQLYNIVNLITEYLKHLRQPISSEILDSLGDQFQELLDSIDESMIDLLAEEVEINNLKKIVNELVGRTLSFYQANEEEKNTLSKIFEIRTERLLPVIERGDFKTLKNSGTNIRLFDEIKSYFDFDNEIWLEDFEPLDQKWLLYILDNGIFKLPKITSELETFNNYNRCDLNFHDVKLGIQLWMRGNWFEEICNNLNIQTYQALGLVNSLIGFNIISAISTVIRVRELIFPDVTFPKNIANWTSFLQYGIDSQIELDIIEIGLTERISVLALAKHLKSIEYSHTDYQTLKTYLFNNKNELLAQMQKVLPAISFDKTKSFFGRLDIRNIL